MGKQLSAEEGSEQCGRLLQSSRAAYKVEVLQEYAGDLSDPSCQAYLRGDVQEAFDLINQPDSGARQWRQMCLDGGVEIHRTHVVAYPISPYLQWEVNVAYQLSLEMDAEKEITLVPQNEVADLDLPAGDWWYFISQTGQPSVLQWHYDEQTVLIGATLYTQDEDTETIRAYAELWPQLQAHAQPLSL